MKRLGNRYISLYRFLVVLSLLAALYWSFADNVLNLYKDVESLANNQSKEEFVMSVNVIRTQWMQTQQREFAIQLTSSELLDVENTVSVRVNKSGFVTQVLSDALSQCTGLFLYLQSQSSKDIKIDTLIDDNQAIGCKYSKNEKLLFKYMFLNGIVSNK